MKTYIPPDPVINFLEVFKKPQKTVFKYFSEKAHFCRDGKTALLNGLRSGHINTGDVILLPAYICESVVIFFEDAGFVVRFFDITLDMQPNFEDLEIKSNNAKALIIVHYYGFPQVIEKVVDFCRSRNLFLIEDCSHALYSRYNGKLLGTFGDVGIYSLKKTLAVPNGGILISKKLFSNFSETDKSFPLISFLILIEKWLEFKFSWSPRIPLLQNEKIRRKIINKNNQVKMPGNILISEYSLNIFSNTDSNDIINKRRENYMHYLRKIKENKNIKIIFPYLEDGVCPLGFPILISNRDQIRKSLLKKKINLRTLWDILPHNTSRCRVAHIISGQILILPTHQSLCDKDINYVISNLLALNNLNG